MSETSREKFGECLLCKRECNLTFHHLIPRKVHRRVHFKKHYSREELNQGISICRLCHSGIHKQYDEMQLAKELNSVGALRDDAVLSRHFKWAGRQKVQK